MKISEINQCVEITVCEKSGKILFYINLTAFRVYFDIDIIQFTNKP